MNQKTLEIYELLKDAFFYATGNWLRMDLSEGNRKDALNIIAGASFLFGRLFAKENPGEELTKAVYEDQETRFNAKDISEATTKLKLLMTGDDFAKGSSAFRNYLTWVAEAEPLVLEAFKDDQGMLCLVTIDSLVGLLPKDQQNEATHIAEIVFLNIAQAFLLSYKGLYGPKLVGLRSSPFFFDLESSFERIRASIED